MNKKFLVFIAFVIFFLDAYEDKKLKRGKIDMHGGKEIKIETKDKWFLGVDKNLTKLRGD